ncbi:MAG: thioredoxin domain-containing protein [Planctomycetaceae bacterium]|nr:thioredoxin domain-containing protein [Planctomycetaceae bacterium]
MPSPLRLAVICSDDDGLKTTSETPAFHAPIDDGQGPPSGSPPSGPSGSVRWFLRILCTIALAVSAYLAWTAFNASPVFGCTGDVFNCGHVLTSAWSKWFGIPVSVPAVGLYASLLAVLVFVGPNSPESLRVLAWKSLTAGAVAAGIAALWFIGLQVFVIGHLCPYCLVAHTCGLLLVATVLMQKQISWKSIRQFGGAGAACSAVLIIGQLLTPPPQTFVVEEFDLPASGSSSSDMLASPDADIFAPPGDEIFAAPGEIEAAPVFESPVADATAVFEAPFIEPAPGDSSPASARDPDSPVVESRDTKSSASNPSVSRSGSDTPEIEPRQPAAASAEKDETLPVISSVLTIIPGAIRSTNHILIAFADETTKSDEATSTEETKAQQPETEEAAGEAEPRIVSVAGDKFRLNAAQWPMVGKCDAKYIMVEMFDYTCPHCRNTHRTIKKACEKYGDDFAIIMLAVPLNPRCNNAISSTGHADACELAKLAVAVWRVSPQQFAEYHNWMFDAGRNRTAGEARTKAEQLVGRQPLQDELNRGIPDQYIQRHVDLYRKVGAGAVPKLMFPRSIMTGEVNSVASLSSAIEKN